MLVESKATSVKHIKQNMELTRKHIKLIIASADTSENSNKETQTRILFVRKGVFQM